jgi:serine/threonine protein phosphatase PrpC
VGDSGLFYVSEGQIQTVNRPHIFANFLDKAVTRGAISKQQALLHPERESLTSYIGLGNLDEIDRNLDPWPLSDGDSILLASDGLFKTLSAGEILDSLKGLPQAWPDALVQRTLSKKHEFQDNVTVLSVTIQDHPQTLKVPPPAEQEVAPAKTARLPAPRKLVGAALIVIAGTAILGGGGRWWYKRHKK